MLELRQDNGLAASADTLLLHRCCNRCCNQAITLIDFSLTRPATLDKVVNSLSRETLLLLLLLTLRRARSLRSRAELELE